MSFQPAFNARLIAEVKKYPCLYNHSKRGSGDTMERMKIWDSIALTVDKNCSGDFAKKRWLQLRDRYRKELKAAIKHNFLTPVRWCYFSHLSWLDPYLKDNIVLAACDGNSKDLDSFSSCMDSLAGLNEVKTEVDDDMEGDGLFEPSVLDRVLASTHRQQSTSPALENDDSGPQSVGTSGVGEDDRAEITINEGILKEDREQRNEKTDHLTRVLQSLQANSNFSIKNQILSRQQQVQQIMNKQILQAGKNAFDWMNDEDMLYSRIIGLRLQKMDPKRRKRVRAQIMCLLEGSDLDDDDSLSPRSPRLEPVENTMESRTDGNTTTAPCSSPALGYPVCL